MNILLNVFRVNSVSDIVRLSGIVIFALVAIVYILVTQAYGRIWLRARLSGLQVSFAELIGMTLRKANAKEIIENLILAKNAGVHLTLPQLEKHYLVKGNISNIVTAMILLDAAGLNPSWEQLAADDILGVDVLKEAQDSVAYVRENGTESVSYDIPE